MAQRRPKATASTTQQGTARAKVTPEALRAAQSILVERMQFAGTAGLSYQDAATGLFKRDLYATLGYAKKLATKDYRDRYERGGIAERIVEAAPRGTWGGGVDVQETPDPDVITPFEQALYDLDDRLGIWSRFMRADILSGLGTYGVLLLGGPGKLDEPLTKLDDAGLLYLTPLGEDRAKILTFVTDTSDPRFGKPEFYTCTLLANGTSAKVHYSRILHVAEGLLEDDLYGRPRLRAVWNYMDDLQKLVGGQAEALWRRMDPGLQVDIDPEIEIDATEEGKLNDMVDEYVHGLRRVLQTRGARVQPLSASVTSAMPAIDGVLDLIGGTTGIPKRILVGSERGELASTQDRGNWAERISERRREFAEPLVRTFVKRLIELGALPESKEFEVVWTESEKVSEAERASIAAAMASANTGQVAAEGMLILTSDEIRDRVYGLEPLPPPPMPEALPGMEEGAPEDEDGEEDGGEGEPPADGEEGGGEEPSGGEQGGSGASGGGKVGGGAQRPPRAAAAARAPVTRAGGWNKVERVVVPHTAPLAGLLLSMWRGASKMLGRAELELVLSKGGTTGVQRMVFDALDRSVAQRKPTLARRLAQARDDAARAALADMKRHGTWYRAAQTSSPVGMSFDSTNARAVAWAQEFSSELITEIDPETKAGVWKIISRSMSESLPPRETAWMISQTVGLRSDQIERVWKLWNSGASEAQVERYARQQLNQRARLIARTELNRSANAGITELWRQAIDKGDIPRGQKRVWIATLDDRVRDAHEKMHGQVRGLDEPFYSPDDVWIEPGEEPNCRCGQALADEADIAQNHDLTQIIYDSFDTGALIDEEELWAALDEADQEKVLEFVGQAEEMLPKFEMIVSQAVQPLGYKLGEMTSPKAGDFFVGPLKSPQRIAAKALHEKSGKLSLVRDGLRATVVLHSPTEVQAIYNRLRAYDSRGSLVDRFRRFTPSGYRDATFNIDLGDGMSAEIEMVMRELWIEKELGRAHLIHAAMKQHREGSPEWRRLQEEVVALYGDLWRDDVCPNIPDFPGCRPEDVDEAEDEAEEEAAELFS